ncbi:MAG: type ISP restriction/modification enzyme [Flavobacterium sp.]|uniref:type ISP restriction/modification enzyme n=1 Tax=Flavobacterium sp. TaxID=239 RepID=UPI003BA80F05
MTLHQYVTNLNTLYQTGKAREHSYRSDLQVLLTHLLPDILVTNEPARSECGAPDYMLSRKDIPVAYIEAKDIGVDLKSKTLKEQFDRYKAGLSNLIFTDYMDFHFYKDGNFVTSVAIAKLVHAVEGTTSSAKADKDSKVTTPPFGQNSKVTTPPVGQNSKVTTPPFGHPSKGGEVVAMPENFETFIGLIQNFVVVVSQTIKSPTKLAEMMAGKAKLMANVIEQSLAADDLQLNRSALKQQMLSFQQMLIHDITNQAFADIYAQTIAYGMFAARYHDPTLPTFSREEAATLIPKSNPFLRKLFQDIAGYDLDNRLVWIVDELVSIFLATDVAVIMKNFGKSTKQEDPVVHFYETFLAAYNPALRKARGVWYTPQPVVNFIVRAVDDLLKSEFGLSQGLADTSKIKIKKKAVTQTGTGANSKIKEVYTEQEVHKVQILDPATGTGTFLAEVVKHIYQKFEGQQGIWSKYVTNDLIPRLNGFELLMASYAMAHLKMDMLLTETGYKPTDDQRFRIFLTNSLEEAHPDTQTLFSSWLSDEADQANAIKRDAPVMVVMGNPPYSGESANKGEWIMNLMEDYKKEPGGKEKLKEQNSKFINDDYVKFMRFGQYFIDKNGSGILAFINPHGFLDNPTFRGMRWNLLKTYDKIYTIDLHGNSKKKETAPDGSPDINVFDIQQGVSINLLVKTGKKKIDDLGEIFHFDLFGKRDVKYSFLSENKLNKIDFNSVNSFKPNFLFKKQNEQIFLEYNNGFLPNEIFPINVMGFQTHRDDFCIGENKDKLKEKLLAFANYDDSEIEISKAYGVKSSSDFNIKNVQKELLKLNLDEEIITCNYRPFENKYICFNKIVVDRPRKELIINSKNKENVLLGIGRQGMAVGDIEWCLTTVSKNPVDANVFRRGGVNLFPLYLYPDSNGQQFAFETVERVPNLNMEIVQKMAEGLGLKFVAEKVTTPPDGHPSEGGEFAPIDILDYIYAVLHSPKYREQYKEFLKIDFPRVPYPKDQKTFFDLVELGGQLREIHLLESPVVEKYITQYPIDGDNVVTKPRFENSPPLEGCPTGGVVKNTPAQPDTYIKNKPIYFNTKTDLPYNPKLKPLLKELRYAHNLSEVLFWKQVHKGHFYSIDFDRQRIIGNYIVDFYVKKLGLVIEIDGSSHDNKEEYDAERQAYLESLGLKVCRIKAGDVLNRMALAMNQVEDFIIEHYGEVVNEPVSSLEKNSNEPLSPLGQTSNEPVSSLEKNSNEPPRPLGTPPKEGNVGRVYINDTQFFANVPEVAWNFYIGGYQPAQKWLKDRKDRELSYEDILHYQKIIVALKETDGIMGRIDGVMAF